ncbi:putative exported protein [Taylorella asinigenitalis 14/45]|uniref:Putative exported protein n=1 Tax=Taylorella asinigenitalis 14/45 TaxID=1091495 RepID=I7J1U2_9BURK|nr:MliC family protein [Taylorella asinigenitalis]CCG19737.1 putative exported protein [Taylorella asinigenitalis 14/45]
MKNLNFALVTLALTAGCASQATTEKTMKEVQMTPTEELQKYIYLCENSKTMQVIYVNTDKQSYALITEMNEIIPLINVPSGSGAIYEAMGTNYDYQLLTKGEEASLQSGNKAILKDCKISNKVKLYK